MKAHQSICVQLALAVALNLSATRMAQAQSSTNTGSLNFGRASIYTANTSMLVLTNGKVLCMKGFDALGMPVIAPELYDPATGNWTLASMNHQRAGETITVLLDGRVLVAGGGGLVTELLNPETGAWTNTGDLNISREGHTATLLPNGKVLIAGGAYQDPSFTHLRSSTELYDPATGLWATNGFLLEGRTQHSAVLLQNGKVLVAGGVVRVGDDLVVTNSAEIYDPATGTSMSIMLNNPVKQSDGSMKVAFTNSSGSTFTALATTNLGLPASNWSVLGGVTEVSPGQFQFTDSQATNHPRRFYRVRSP